MLDDFIGFHFVNRVRQSMRAQRRVLAYRFRQIRAVNTNAAGENESSNDGIIAIGLGDSLYYAGGAGHVDLPHAVQVEHPCADGIKDKSQVNYGDGASFPQQKE